MSSTALAVSAEPIKEADPVTAMITAADTLPGISAYPAEVRASEENGVYRLEKVYYLTAKDDPATIPTADFEREGHTYTLLDLLKNDQTETDTREHIEVVTLESKTKDMAEILKMLEPKLEVKTEDGYEGVLSLDHTTIQVEAAGYGTSSRTVTAERTYPNLSDADVSLVPKSVNENGRTLTLADVSWQEAAVDPTDGYDIPIRYTAVASYTGTATKYVTVDFGSLDIYLGVAANLTRFVVHCREWVTEATAIYTVQEGLAINGYLCALVNFSSISTAQSTQDGEVRNPL